MLGLGSDAMAATILDGPMGTELLARGVVTPLPGWSAHALETAAEVVRAIHADYAAAGAEVLTTNTFRARERVFGERWEEMVRIAVGLALDAQRGTAHRAVAPGETARRAVPAGEGPRVAGSVAPLEDCYRPEMSPAGDDPDAARREHGEMVRVLVDAGCDLILCETFSHVGEGLIAVDEAAGTGVETWAAFTPGYKCDLLTERELGEAGREAVKRGASAVLVNCAPASRTLGYVQALLDATSGDVPVGAYANAGEAEEKMGWRSGADEPARYADASETWIEAGAGIVGSCCGTGVGHIAELARRFR